MKSSEPETFEHGPGGRRATFVVLSRKTVEEYEREARAAAYMRANKIVATVRARKLRGTKEFLFWEVDNGRGGVWYALARGR
jgi:hypothetical protein